MLGVAGVTAIDTNDHTAPNGAASVNVDGLDAKIAAMAGIPADQIVVNDMKVNPISKNVYLSASRGRGPDAPGRARPARPAH